LLFEDEVEKGYPNNIHHPASLLNHLRCLPPRPVTGNGTTASVGVTEGAYEKYHPTVLWLYGKGRCLRCLPRRYI